MRWSVLDSPIGELSVAVDEVGVCGVRFGAVAVAVPSPADGHDAAGGDGRAGGDGPAVDPADGHDRAVRELRGYFAGELTDFSVPLSVRAGSEFERAVWATLSRIPYGDMWTYGQVAAAVGDRGAARAVGVACNRNPIPLIVPCHRVVGAGGKLVGFGGGMPRKRQLLELEARVALQRAWS